MRVWIDTDIGSDVDDALTLGYVLRQPEFELVGLSTVFGDTPLRTRIARALLEISGAPDIPVITGLGTPLSEGRDGRMFGHEGLGLLDDPDPVMITRQDPDADLRIDTLAMAMRDAAPEAVLSIGPMTNLGALALRGAPIPPLTIMGGKFTDAALPGTLPQIPEWNWWCDPAAVTSVLTATSGVPPRVVPIEVTLHTVLSDADRDLLSAGDALARTLARLCDEWLVALRERLGSKDPKIHLHDPLAAMTMVDEAICPFEPRQIRIDEQGVTHHEADGTRVEVAVDVDHDRLRTRLNRAWLSEPRS